ncbi:trypsin-like peptidase domain-containing protein [Ancylobacter sp. VKM B-3255]|uniref:Trypsin-like peptidase domain-containing protein n=2 Tax=Ancylobacter radicis TaxID=2836179 RepID=A0ABS5R9J0_9HYPH|nr:trypsin-like peptidase domain-containing protein [Ancylobacter radicis]
MPMTDARAGDVGAALAGGAVGFALGVMTGNAMARNPGQPANRRPKQPKPAPVVVDQTTINIQTALKFFTFYNGAVDGKNGPGTRRAVAAFQKTLDVEPTGTLTQVQYDVLMQAYTETKAKGTAGPGGNVPRSDPGVDQLFAAISRTPDDGTPAHAAAGPAAAFPATATPADLPPAVAPPSAGTSAAGAATPSPTPMLAALTSADATAETPDLAYNEVCIGRRAVKKAGTPESEAALRAHFCRSFAIATEAGNAAIETAGDVNVELLLTQCGKVRDAVAGMAGDFAEADPAATIDDLGSRYAALSETVKAKAMQDFLACTGVGLNERDAGIVNAAALALAALGRPAYGEFIAASLALGLGEPRDVEAAEQWYRYLASRAADQPAAPPPAPLPDLVAASPDAASIDTSTPAASPRTAAGPADEPRDAPVALAMTVADIAAFAGIADALGRPDRVQVAAATEATLIPQLDMPPASEPVIASPAPAIAEKPTMRVEAEVAALAAGTPATATPLRKALSNAEIASLIKDSIVAVYDPASDSWGTGFLMGPSYILTNAHVVMGAKRLVIASRRYGVRAANVVGIGMTDKGVGIDAAVLETVNWTADRHLSFNPMVREGEPVAIGGFPGRASQVDRSSERFFEIISQNRIPGMDDIPAPKFDFGHVQSVFVDSRTGLRNIQEGLETSGGNSGSPVTNACGDVVGLHYAGSQAVLKVAGGRASGDTSKFNYAIASDEVLKFLNSINIRHSAAPAPCGG